LDCKHFGECGACRVYENGYDAQLNETDAQNIQDTLRSAITDITTNMQNNRFDIAAEKIYHFIWDYFASELIEESKPLLQSDDEATKTSRQKLLRTYLVASLKILHPFMPFVTETIWQELPKEMKEQDLLMVESWPEL